MGDGATVTTVACNAIDPAPKSRGLQPARQTRVEEACVSTGSAAPPSQVGDADVGENGTAQAEAHRSLICCPQAIFTSIRSPMGQGYRIVAASPGVRAEEKIEITRRSPSHGGLCDPSADAVGLLSFPLAAGRHCVGCCIHAGVEHTARGGLRVYSHMVVLESNDFETVAADPLPIHTAMLERLRQDGPNLTPPPSLGPLALEIPTPATLLDTEPAAETCAPPAQAEAGISVESPPPANPAIAAIAADLEAGRNVIVTGATEPMSVLRTLMGMLPVEVRRCLSMSAGLTYSPGRRLQLVFLPEEDSQLRRLVAGQSVVIHHLQ